MSDIGCPEECSQNGSAPDPRPVTGCESHLKAGAEMDRAALDKVILALGARFAEHEARTDARLAEMDARLALDMKALRSEAAETAARFRDEFAARVGALERRVAALREELAAELRPQALEHELAELRNSMDRRLGVLQTELPSQLKAIVQVVGESFDGAITTHSAQVHNLREYVSALDSRIQALQRNFEAGGDVAAPLETLAGSERKLDAMIAGIGQLFRTAGTEGPPAGEAERAAPPIREVNGKEAAGAGERRPVPIQSPETYRRWRSPLSP